MIWRTLGSTLLRRFRKNDRGATAVEFALVGAPFIWLLGCVFETSLMLFSEQVIENGVTQAARMIRTGQVQTEGISAGQFKAQVCDRLLGLFDCENQLHIDVRKFTAFKDVVLPEPMNGDELSSSVTTGASFQPGGPMDVVVVRAYYEWDLFMPGISLLANMKGNRRLLTSGAAFRNEPYAPI